MQERPPEPPPSTLSMNIEAELRAAGLDPSLPHKPPFDQVNLPAAGTLVEVRMLDDGLLGSRYPASVVDWEVRFPGEGGSGEARALVEYEGLYASDKAEGVKVCHQPRLPASRRRPPYTSLSHARPPHPLCSPYRAPPTMLSHRALPAMLFLVKVRRVLAAGALCGVVAGVGGVGVARVGRRVGGGAEGRERTHIP